MRNRDEILAEVLDSLMRHDSYRSPSEARELFSLGLRLYNECPDADPAFLECLGRRLEEERAARERARDAAGYLAFLCRLRERRVLRPLLAVAVVAMLLGLAALVPGLRTPVEARLSRVITAFRGVEVREQPRMVATPLATTDVRVFSSLEEARQEAGFALRVPSYLPPGVRFRQALYAVTGGRGRVMLQFAGPTEADITWSRSSAPAIGEDVLVINQSLVGADGGDVPLSIPVGEESTEAIRVAGRTALWVKGHWSATGRWERDPRYGMLQLQDGDVFLLVSSVLGQEETVRVMKSMLE